MITTEKILNAEHGHDRIQLVTQKWNDVDDRGGQGITGVIYNIPQNKEAESRISTRRLATHVHNI